MPTSPRFVHSLCARIYNPILINQFRSLLALGLAALIFLSPLTPTTALAQTQSARAAVPKTGDAAPGKAFIVYETEDGVGCRSASPDEKREMFNPGSGQTLRQINHLKSSEGESLREDAVNGSGPGLKIILLGTPQLDANTVAKNAFIAAAAHWESIIQTPMTVYMKVDYGNTRFGQAWPAGVLASTGTPSVFAGYSAVRNNLLAQASNSGNSKIALYNLLPANAVPTDLGDDYVMGVNISVARAIGLIPADASADATNEMPSIAFNSTKVYDFDPSPAGGPGCNNNGIECNKTDFDAVATHEIGHALGFTSNNGEGGEPPNMDVWDLFRFRPGVTNFNSNQRIMSAGGSQVFFDGGATELAVSTGGPDGEGTGGDGAQSSHWKEDNDFLSAYIGIMDPTISAGRREVITDNDKRALNAFGYNLDNNAAPPPAPPPPPPPGNNNFGSAQVISGCSGSIFGTNLGATKENGEPNHSPDNGGGQRSVWFKWTAPSTGSVTFTTKGSSYDTVLGIYSGNSVGNLSLLGKNDDVVTGSDTSSRVIFDAVAGTTYMIAVDGYNNGSGGDMGNVKLNWSQNDCTVTATNDIKLSQPNYSYDESTAQGFGLLSVDVIRGDPNAGHATVQYSTEDAAGGSDCNVVTGNASQRCDYATAAGTLRFAPGEATKTIQIPIILDGYVEGNETFTLKLQNATGATLGANSQATVTIQDSGIATTASQNSYLNNSFFVRQLYLDILGREPDAGGFATWTGVLNNCGPEKGFLGAPRACDRAFVSHGFVASPEFTDRGYHMHRMYEVGARRLPRYSEFVPEMAGLSGAPGSAELEQNTAQYAENFVLKPEFTANYGSVSTTAQAAQFIALLEQNAGVTLPATTTTLPGQPTQYNRQDLINKRASGEFSLGKTLRSFVEQKVVYDRYFERGFVTIQYFGFLRRDPDLNDPGLAGWTEWVFVFTNGGAQRGRPDIGPRDIQHLIFGFIYSEEYRKRFGQP